MQVVQCVGQGRQGRGISVGSIADCAEQSAERSMAGNAGTGVGRH